MTDCMKGIVTIVNANIQSTCLLGLISKRNMRCIHKGQSLFLDIYICFTKLHAQPMKKLEMKIIQTIYKLEMIFPIYFFNLIEYLPIHLLFEKKVGGLQMHPN